MRAETGLRYKIRSIKWQNLLMVLDSLKNDSPLCGRLCEDNIAVSSGGYYGLASAYAKKLNICGNTAVVFDIEDNLSAGPSVPKTTDKRTCHKCRSRVGPSSLFFKDRHYSL